ncbi:peptide/nickel transport system substrate-binding protein [Chitinophaga rupis]|uniref:Peptide/nickel transport system substrate-binding protein n=1 Tax=Chitinophaga rupis TaxID=573321 RepID=A0A1H7SQA0_9BACT|nr:ABC transporter substrate-binding protein [Chitinophaga rupis]SEL74276.1 peptide/nickel transport system substrate-binding protein [Chitinophaga rupis]
MTANKRKSTSVIVLINCVISAFTFVMGCQPDHRSNTQVFRFNHTDGLSSLDPAFAKSQAIMWAVHQVYSTLVEPDTQMVIRPLLATRWEESADHTTFTFYLRPDVYFHDNDAFVNGKGRRMTAQDVVYSFRRIMDPATASPGAWIFNGKVDPKEGFKALNDTVFQLKLLQPFHPILGILSMQYCSIVPKEVVEKYGADFRRHPCGTGPFRYFDWDEGQALILHRHPHYFEKDAQGKPLPYLDAVKMTFLDNKATEFLLFRQGQLDFMNDLDASFKDEVLTKTGQLKKEWNGKMVLSKTPYLNVEYLGFMLDSSQAALKQSPTRLKKVRLAINYGFDRTKMMTYLRNSIGVPANAGFVPRGLPSFDAAKVKGYTYDPARARQLLQEAGFPEGKGLPRIRLLTIPVYADLSNYIANQLQELGIPVQVEVVQKSLLLEQTAKSAALFFRGSWIADYPDAESFLAFFYGKNPAPPNYTRYNNPDFDKLYEQALQETNDSLRYELYRQMDQLIVQDAPLVPVFYDEAVHFIQPNVKGLREGGLNMLELRWVKMSR